MFKSLFHIFVTLLQSSEEACPTFAAFCITTLIVYEGLDVISSNDTQLLWGFIQMSLQNTGCCPPP